MKKILIILSILFIFNTPLFADEYEVFTKAGVNNHIILKTIHCASIKYYDNFIVFVESTGKVVYIISDDNLVYIKRIK
jgi:hypothetical protein